AIPCAVSNTVFRAPGNRSGYLPSLLSSGIGLCPGLARTKYGVERDDELAHDGGDHDFEGFAVLAQLDGEPLHDRVVPNGHEGGHVERASDAGSAGRDM